MSSAGAASGWLQPTARASMRARPLATRPLVHAVTRTPAPSSPLEQLERYPLHPLNAFFHQDRYRVLPPRPGQPSSAPSLVPVSSTTTPLQPAKGEREVGLPAVLPESVFGHDSSSRSYLAPELRLKSSHELHALWYVLLLERNRLATSRDEAKRLGLANLLQIHQTNLSNRAHRVRKSMARIKLVLNERRLALLQAQQDVRSEAAAADNDQGLLHAAATQGADLREEEGGGGSLYEEDEPVQQPVQHVGRTSSSSSSAAGSPSTAATRL